MATCSSNATTLFNPQNLQSLCHLKIDSHFTLEKELYHLHLYGDLGYTFTFERIVHSIRQIANNRHKLKQKSFEKWFRRYVNKRMDLLKENRDEPKKMQRIAKDLVYRICQFRAVFGVAEKVLDRVKCLVYVLGKY